MAFTQALDSLVTTIECQGGSLRPWLQPGLPREAIQARLTAVGLAAPPVVYELYHWHNGMHEAGATPLFDEHYFLPLDAALDEYAALVPAYTPHQQLFALDFTACLPFASFMGSYYVVYCHPQPVQGVLHPVVRIFEGVDLAFTNLPTMVQTMTQWYTSGAYQFTTHDAALKQ